jgi:hypothetical protein
MNVKELKEALKDIPDEAIVMIMDHDYGSCDAEYIDVGVRMTRGSGADTYFFDNEDKESIVWKMYDDEVQEAILIG